MTKGDLEWMVEPEFEPGQTDPRAQALNHGTGWLMSVTCGQERGFSSSTLLSSQLLLSTCILEHVSGILSLIAMIIILECKNITMSLSVSLSFPITPAKDKNGNASRCVRVLTYNNRSSEHRHSWAAHWVLWRFLSSKSLEILLSSGLKTQGNNHWSGLNLFPLVVCYKWESSKWISEPEFKFLIGKTFYWYHEVIFIPNFFLKMIDSMSAYSRLYIICIFLMLKG